MLVSMNPLRLYEVVAGYAKAQQKYILQIDLHSWLSISDAAKKDAVKQFYLDYIPVDEHVEIFANELTFYEFNTEARAVDTAYEWFPPRTSLEDLDYFIHAQVITPGGSISYTNKDVERPA